RNGAFGSAHDFAERFRTLNQFIHDSLPEEHPLYGAKALPRPERFVPVFLLGASVKSAKLAAEQGVGFVFARFLNGNDDVLKEAIQMYRDIYPTGKFITAIATFAAATQLEAEEEAANYKIFKIHFSSGRSLSV